MPLIADCRHGLQFQSNAEGKGHRPNVPRLRARLVAVASVRRKSSAPVVHRRVTGCLPCCCQHDLFWFVSVLSAGRGILLRTPRENVRLLSRLDVQGDYQCVLHRMF